MAGQALAPRLGGREWLSRALADRHRATYVAAAAVVGVLAVAHRVGLGAPVFPVDDAYITLHNAQVLLSGHDPNFPGASALTGATSPVHLALVALCSIPFGARNGLYLAMWIGILLYATGIVRLAFAWRAGPARALLLLALGLIAARMPHQLLNGLETGLALAAVTWALALASEPGRERALAAVCGLMPFVRPELGVVSIGLLAVKAVPVIRGRRWRDLRGMAIFGAAAAAPWALWSLLATGALLPSTAGAKMAWFAERHLPAATKKEWFGKELRQFASTVGILLAAGLAALLSWPGRVMVVFAGIFLAFYYVDFPGALDHYEQRYLYVLVPGLLLGVAWALGRTTRWLRWAALAFTVVALAQAAANFSERWDHYRQAQGFTNTALVSVAAWVNHNVPPGSKLMIHDAGFISYATKFEMVDLVGLKTPRLIHFHEKLTEPTAGAARQEAVYEIAMQERPQYLVVLSGWDRLFQISYALSSRGWRVVPLRGGDYTVYKLTPPTH